MKTFLSLSRYLFQQLGRKKTLSLRKEPNISTAHLIPNITFIHNRIFDTFTYSKKQLLIGAKYKIY